MENHRGIVNIEYDVTKTYRYSASQKIANSRSKIHIRVMPNSLLYCFVPNQFYAFRTPHGTTYYMPFVLGKDNRDAKDAANKYVTKRNTMRRKAYLLRELEALNQ